MPKVMASQKKMVQTAKHILTKSCEEGKDLYLSILEHRNAPVDDFKSPAQLLMSRRLGSIIPITGSATANLHTFVSTS